MCGNKTGQRVLSKTTGREYILRQAYKIWQCSDCGGETLPGFYQGSDMHGHSICFNCCIGHYRNLDGVEAQEYSEDKWATIEQLAKALGLDVDETENYTQQMIDSGYLETALTPSGIKYKLTPSGETRGLELWS